MAKIYTCFTGKLHDSSAHYQYFGEKGLEQVYNMFLLFNLYEILFVAFLCIYNLYHENIRDFCFSLKYGCVGSRFA